MPWDMMYITLSHWAMFIACHVTIIYFTNICAFYLVKITKGPFHSNQQTHPNWTGWEQKKTLFLPCSLFVIWARNLSWIHQEFLATGILPPPKKKETTVESTFQAETPVMPVTVFLRKTVRRFWCAYVGSHMLLTAKSNYTPENYCNCLDP